MTQKNRSKSCKTLLAPAKYLLKFRLQRTQGSEEPSVLSRRVSLLQCLLNSLLRVLPLGNLLESICGNNTLQSLQLKCVTCWHQVVVVDDLDKRLNLGALGLSGLRHALGDLRWIAVDTSNQCVRVRVRLVSGVLRLNDHDLHISPSAFTSSWSFSIRSLIQFPIQFFVHRARGRLKFTFFPAYLPRVMMATRPTLRTRSDQVSTPEQLRSSYSSEYTHTSCRLSLGCRLLSCGTGVEVDRFLF